MVLVLKKLKRYLPPKLRQKPILTFFLTVVVIYILILISSNESSRSANLGLSNTIEKLTTSSYSTDNLENLETKQLESTNEILTKSVIGLPTIEVPKSAPTNTLTPSTLDSDSHSHSDSDSDSEDYVSKRFGIYSKLFTLVADCKPELPPLENYRAANTDIQKFGGDNTAFTKKFLEDLLPLDDPEKDLIATAYNKFKRGMKTLGMDVFGRDDDVKSVKGKGVVLVGGGKFSWLSLLNIHQLRKTGSNLPVEVYIPTEKDYDESFCENVLPDLHARCILGYEELPFKEFEIYFNLQRYEYKMMAILASSFKEVLLLDADNMVLENPDKLFSWDVYKENHLILWPDVWQRTTNPFMFDLVNISIDYSSVEDMENYNLHNLPGAIQNPSTESGMMLINKQHQLDTLLISLYFNIYGFDYYYPLITQGSAGQGDKDTYIFAAHGANKPVYQLKQSVSFVGRFTQRGEFKSGALGQCDPMTENEEIARKDNLKSIGCSKQMFLHLSVPKFYPNTILDFLYEDDSHVIEFDGVSFPYDFELQIWEIMCQLLCDNYKPNSFQPDNPASRVMTNRFRKSGKELSYIQSIEIDDVCNKQLLPHLEFMRTYYKFANKSKRQYEQNWEGKHSYDLEKS